MISESNRTRFDQARADVAELVGRYVAVQIHSVKAWTEVASIERALVTEIIDIPADENGTSERMVRVELSDASGEKAGSFTLTEDMLEGYQEEGLANVEANLASVGLRVYPVA